MSESERVQKILARAGIASRRKCEELITEGSVTINGKVAKLGDKATFGEDAIKVNGKLLRSVQDKIYLLFYKPRAVISMLVDNENRPNLSDYITKIRTRVFPVGRLDFNSEGLILMTNDGVFAEKVQKSDQIARIYAVKVKGKVDEDTLRRLEKGARIEHAPPRRGYTMVRPHSVRLLKEMDAKSHVEIVIVGGGAVDIRALCEMKGLLVDKITRTAIGHLTLKGLVPGHFRELKESQAQALIEQPELGLKRLAAEIEDERPKGQRNYHEKKDLSEPREEGLTEYTPRESDSGESKAPIKPRSTPVGDRPARAPYGSKPARGPSRGGDRPTRAPYGSKPARGPSYSGGGDRPTRAPYGSKPARGPSYSGGGDRPTRAPYGSKPARSPSYSGGPKPYNGSKPSYSDSDTRSETRAERGPVRRAGAVPKRSGGARTVDQPQPTERSSNKPGRRGDSGSYGISKPGKRN